MAAANSLDYRTPREFAAAIGTLAAKQEGLDWEEVLDQRARERMRELGLLDAAERLSQRPIANEPQDREEVIAQ